MNLDELFWDDLLLYLEQRQVIPIIGQDLLTVEIDGRSVNAYRLVAERLAADLKVSPELLRPDFTLSQVIAAHPRFREKRSLIYSQTKATFDRLPVSIPEPLRLLARIPAFRIFVTTTFDPWMERALVEWYGIDGRRCLTKDGYAKVTTDYDERGNQVAWACIGLHDRPAINKADGTHPVNKSYD